MCGIVGYVGKRDAAKVVFDSLCRLEYRGYDSAGIAVMDGKGIEISKCKGRLSDLKPFVDILPASTQGIGHTRWATHGVPNDTNAHPHKDCSGRTVLVHNGIIENHLELRERLSRDGHRIVSETDTELAVHLIEENYRGNLFDALREAVRHLEGSMALVAMDDREPGKIVAYREKSPLIIGVGDGEMFLASDIPAILPYTDKAIVMNDGDFAVITRDGVKITDIEGKEVKRPVQKVDIRPEAAEKGGYDHFMLKEIHEQPEALAKALQGRIRDGRVMLSEDEFSEDESSVQSLDHIVLIACGTAYHAGLVGKMMFERLAGIRSEAWLASEFRYARPLIGPDTLAVAISQSGETLDTLAACREAKERGSRVVAITNSPLSSIAREADDVMIQRAGPEIAVASTKAYTTQILCLALAAIRLGELTGSLSIQEIRTLTRELLDIPAKAQKVVEQASLVEHLAQEIADVRDIFFIGRGVDYLTAMESQLKLKEISYIHAEAYAAGELKHGPLSLIAKDVPVVAISTDPELAPKTASNVMEVKARGGKVIAVGTGKCLEYMRLCPEDTMIQIPECFSLFSPALAVIPLQLLSYYVAKIRGNDIDKPRNLAKSVTVE